MVEDALKQIDAWYREPTEGELRPKLLSKLATLELCGWLEGEFDRLMRLCNSEWLQDSEWTEAAIDKTYGFKYSDHFRPMFAKLAGEYFVRIVEIRMETDHPGELERLNSILGGLWRSRCNFAHADLGANIRSQQTFLAPSWANNQYKTLKKIMVKLENSLIETLRASKVQ